MTQDSNNPTLRQAPPTGSLDVRVLIVDDIPQVRLDLRLLLELVEKIQVVGEAANGSDAIAKAKELHPSVVIMDVEMPGMDGFEATRQIISGGLAAKVIILSIHAGPEILRQAVLSGASELIQKGENIEHLIHSILQS
mgnify:CR=1 FL=1